MRNDPFSLCFAALAAMSLSSTWCLAKAQQPLLVVNPPVRGMMPAFSAGMVFDDSPGVIARKQPGLPGQLDTFENTATPEVSEYSGEAVLARLRAQTTGNVLPLVFDAISSGNDLLPLVWVKESRTFQVVNSAAQAWATLYMTLTGGDFDGVSVYGYYSENPTFPLQLRSAIYTELVRSDFAPGNLPVPGNDARMAAFDVAMGLIHDNRGIIESGVIECVDRLYFSLTPTSAQELWNSGAVPSTVPHDGATIFVATYDTNTGLVESVEVHRTRESLGLPEGTDIDALGVGEVGVQTSGGTIGTPLVVGSMVYVLSTVYDATLPPIEELVVVATPMSGGGEERGGLRAHNGQPLVGPGAPAPFDEGRVSNVCEQDPETSIGTMSFGVPRTLSMPNAPAVAPLNLSLTASWQGANPPTDDFVLTGVVSGSGQAGPAYVFLAVGNVQLGQWDLFALPPRMTTDAYSFQLPLSYAWNGPVNQYEIFVATLPMQATSPTFDVTHASWLRRRYYF